MDYQRWKVVETYSRPRRWLAHGDGFSVWRLFDTWREAMDYAHKASHISFREGYAFGAGHYWGVEVDPKVFPEWCPGRGPRGELGWFFPYFEDARSFIEKLLK